MGLYTIVNMGSRSVFIVEMCSSERLWLFPPPFTVPTSAAMATPSSDSTVSNGVYVPTGIANGDVKPVISTTPLADFLMQLEDYTPTVSPHILQIFAVYSLVIALLTNCLCFRSQTQSQDTTSTELGLKHQIQECELTQNKECGASGAKCILKLK